MDKANIGAVVLAAGRGTRMGGESSKVLQTIDEKSIIYWALYLLDSIGIKNITVVTGFDAENVENEIANFSLSVKTVRQNEQLGTAHSLKIGLTKVTDEVKDVLVLFCDDASLYSPSTLNNFLDMHTESKAKASFLILKVNGLSDIGGLDIDDSGNVVGVLTKEELLAKNMTEHYVLCGAFCFDTQWIKENIDVIKINPVSGEYPLPAGIIGLSQEQGIKIATYTLSNEKEWNSVNTKNELLEAQQKKKDQKL